MMKMRESKNRILKLIMYNFDYPVTNNIYTKKLRMPNSNTNITIVTFVITDFNILEMFKYTFLFKWF